MVKARFGVGLKPLTFVAKAAMKIELPYGKATRAWGDLGIDQDVEYEFFPCEGAGYSNHEPGEWAFKRKGVGYFSSRVLAQDVPEVHATLCDLMSAKRRDRTKCELCGSKIGVETGPWMCAVYVDLGVTDAALCFSCANYRPVGETGPLIQKARLDDIDRKKRERQERKVKKLKELGFIARIRKPVIVFLERLNHQHEIHNGDFIEFGWLDSNSWQLRNGKKVLTISEPACIIWLHKELRRIQARMEREESEKHAKLVAQVRGVQETRFKNIFEEIEE